MKANPGGAITGEAIIGRKVEIADIWRRLEKRSVLLSAERRVGKTTILRKMKEEPQDRWVPLLCFVEDARHPIDLVVKLYDQAKCMATQSRKGAFLSRVRKAREKLAGTEVAGWKLPQVEASWKRLLSELVQDIVENTNNHILVMLDEFPMMIANIIDTPKSGEGASLAMELLDTLRSLRQQYEPSDQVRFLLSGSIGLHLIIEDLKRNHAYKGNPTNNMALKVLSGLRDEDVQLMCRKYLDDEDIVRSAPKAFDRRMCKRTDGLPLYIQLVCDKFQDEKRESVGPDDIDTTLRQMMDSPEVEWFKNSAERIDGRYIKLGRNRIAAHLLNFIAKANDLVGEEDAHDYVANQEIVDDRDIVRATLALLVDDNYLQRDTSTGERRYRFRYELMRWWWEINRA